MEPKNKLLCNAKNTISDQELQRLFAEPDYYIFHMEVEKLVESGVLVPIKSSKKNGRLPPLFNKYRIIKPREDYTGFDESIRPLNPGLNIAGYLQRPDLYKKHLAVLEGISKYLWFAQDLLAKPMSRKERSFSIWGREKLLDEHLARVKEVLRYNHLEDDFLNYYDTPEPFFEYHHSQRGSRTVLVIENKDTWFTFRRLMQATGKNIIAGTAVDVLLYGEGNKITKKGALEQYFATMLLVEKLYNQQENSSADNKLRERVPIEFLYFGDLDWEGIRLFFRTRDANPALDLKPFAGLYRLMLQLAESMELPKSPDQRGLVGPLPEFLSLLEMPEEKKLGAILSDGRYIPQEIINYQIAEKILT